MMTWDDLRFFLALVRNGTVRGAALALGVNHATVSRRLARLESRLGTTLLQRTPEGFRLMPDGERLLGSAEAIEQEVARAEQLVEGRDEELTGTVRIAMPDLVHGMVKDVLPGILASHPGLTLDVTINARLTPIELGQTDIALRMSMTPPEDMVGLRLGRITGAVFGSRNAVFSLDPDDLGRAPWVRWQAAWQNTAIETWPRRHFPDAHVAARIDNYAALLDLVRQGVGLGLLTRWSAAPYPELVQVTDLIDEAGLDLWLLKHPDLRGLRRVRVVSDALAAHLRNRFT